MRFLEIVDRSSKLSTAKPGRPDLHSAYPSPCTALGFHSWADSIGTTLGDAASLA